jgi:hypothetical protein
MRWLFVQRQWRLVAGLSPRRLGLDRSSVCVGLVVDAVAVGRGLSEYFGFPVTLFSYFISFVQNSSVSVVTRLRVGRYIIQIPPGARNLHVFAKLEHRFWGHLAARSVGTGRSFRTVYWPGSKAEQLSPSTAEVMKEWSLTSSPRLCLRVF